MFPVSLLPMSPVHTHNPANRTVLFTLNESGSRLPRVLGFPDHREEKNP